MMRPHGRAFLAMSLMVATGCVGVHAQVPAAVQPQARTPFIFTTASGEAKFVPDRARLNVAVQTRATTAAQAGRANAAIQRAVFDTSHALGFGDEQLSTSSYSVQPEYQYDKQNNVQRVIGYVVSNDVIVDVRRLDGLGAAIDAVLAKGANQISGLDFYSSNDDQARRTALAAAVAKARADAEVMAKAAGGSLGQLLELTQTSTVSVPRPMMALRGAVAADAVTPISAGEESANVSVAGRWEFVPHQ